MKVKSRIALAACLQLRLHVFPLLALFWLVGPTQGVDVGEKIILSDKWSLGKVHELCDHNLTEGIYRFETVLVNFYASWCQHCKALQPELVIAAEKFAAQQPPVGIAKIDVENCPKMATKYNIRKLPSLLLFQSGQPTPYAGPREALGMVPFINRQLSPDVETLVDESAIKEFVIANAGKGMGLFIGFGLDAATIQPIASKYKRHAWFAVHSEVTDELMAKYDFDTSPALLAIHGVGEMDVFYGPFEEGSDMEDFVHQHHMPLMIIMDEETYPRIVSSRRPIVLLMADFDSQAPKDIAMDRPEPSKVDSPAADSVRFVRRCKPIARRFKNYVFSYVDASKYASFVEPFGITKDTKLPKVVVWNGGIQYYSPENEEEFKGDDMEFALARFLHAIDEKRIIAKKTKDPPLHKKIQNVVTSPNFPFAIGIVLIALAIKFGRKGENVLIPKLGFVKKKRLLEQQQRERENANTHSGQNNESSAEPDVSHRQEEVEQLPSDKKRD